MVENIKILVCEDETSLAGLLVEILQNNGYKVTWAGDGRDGWKLFQEDKFDIVILDVMMPHMDGYAVAKEIRRVNPHVPIVFLTAMSMKENVLEGLRAGADDYIAKPFSLDELLLRLEAILRRAGKIDRPETEIREVYRLGRYVFNTRMQTLTLGENTQRMTTKETELLSLLCKFANETLERPHALEVIWGITEPAADPDHAFTQRSMDVYITKLRRMLSADPSVEIKNVHGRGYKLLVPDFE
ncbi:MAG: response regulator transcription factor [Porphyromonas sp.]|nr:response regulator transcription factor [Porphyromonas sp.]